MMDYDMKRNGSGYYDETPVKTGLFGNTPQPGEIWETSQGKEALVLKNHGKFCTTVFLMDKAFDDTMEIISREVRHINPAMLGYLFCRDLGSFIKTIPQEKYLDIMQAVGERLGVTVKVSRAEEADEADKVPNDYMTGNINLAAELEGLKHRCKAIENENNALRAELKDSEEMYHMACEMVKEAKDAGESAERVAADLHTACAEAEGNAVMWEKMYNTLLDRLLARGETK